MDDAEFSRHLLEVNLEDEMRQSYMDYAMSVIVGRALPDVRDGLKPVQRRVLYAMQNAGVDWNKPYRKSAKVVGEVVGNFHPHGETAVYDTIVRMARDFSLRYPVIAGQGNFGSVDGDAPAAMRYTEVRLARVAHQLLEDIDKETVDFVPNYDNSQQEPTVLPAGFPHLLVNGSSGIAVGMATNIPPHNLGEVIDATVALIDDPQAPLERLLEHLPGPDFPTRGIIYGTGNIHTLYQSGRGRVLMRARTQIEQTEGGGVSIVVIELPYQVNKALLMQKIADGVKNKKLTGIRGLRDETNRDGMRMVIELRRGEIPEVVLNNLYQDTQMQTTFGVNMVALEGGRPRLMNLPGILRAFIHHRREVVTRRTLFLLRKAQHRAHVLEGLAVAQDNIDPVVALIKASPNMVAARQALLDRSWSPDSVLPLLRQVDLQVLRPEDAGGSWDEQGYRFSEIQAQAILDMRLHRLTSLEQEKILAEYRELIERIQDLNSVLAQPARVMQIIRDELLAIRERFADERRTLLVEQEEHMRMEDLITEEDVAVTLSHIGYVKAQPIADYRSQRRGGVGRTATGVKEEDFIDQFFIASTHDSMLCFSSLGRLYWMKVYELPQTGSGARGKPIVNLLSLSGDERITAVLSVREYSRQQSVFMTTSDGTVKKVVLQAFSRPRAKGIIAINLVPGNQLVGVSLVEPGQQIMLFSSDGRAVRFSESDVRATGRASRGIRGIRLPPGSRLIAMAVVDPDAPITVLTATANGYGKRTPMDQYSVRRRGGRGLISIQTSARNGPVIGAVIAHAEDEIMLISNRGRLVRTPVAGISVVGRNTQGVRLIRLQKNEQLVGMERIAEERNGETSEQP